MIRYFIGHTEKIYERKDMGRILNKYLKKKIDSHKVISFDIFDTLIKRNCRKPSDIFYIVEKAYNDSHVEQINDFHSKRVAAELNARQHHKSSEDVTIKQIYEQIDYDEKVSNELKNIELKTELIFCQKNHDIEEVYNYCVENKKRIICTSDMYLDASIIIKILDAAGYTELEKVYISSALNKTKYTGSLYDYVINDLNISGRDMLHIGDSKKADYLRPKLKGISSYIIKRKVDNCSYIKDDTSDITSNILYSYINNNTHNNDDEYYKVGFELIGPLVYAFCQWLHKQVVDNKSVKLFFCARDMQFTQKVFNLLYGGEIPNEYLYISRISVGKSMLYKSNSFEYFMSTVTPKNLLISELLKSKGIMIDDLETLLKEYGIESGVEYNNATLDNEAFRKFYDDVISKYVEDKFEGEYINFRKYMDSIGFDPATAVLVDLGWNGTIQYSLQKIYGQHIKGYYLGVETDLYEDMQSHMSGYLFDGIRNLEMSKKVYSFKSLFEVFFSATHGTTIGYTGDETKPIVLEKYENINSYIIESIHAGTKAFVEGFINNYSYLDDIDISIIINGLIKLGTNPTYKHACAFGNLNFDNLTSGKFAEPNKLGYYLLHPRILKADIFASEWKIGFLKRLLKIKLPYYSIYSFLKEKSNISD